MNAFLIPRSGQFLNSLTKGHCLKYIYSRLNHQKLSVLRRISQNNYLRQKSNFHKFDSGFKPISRAPLHKKTRRHINKCVHCCKEIRFDIVTCCKSLSGNATLRLSHLAARIQLYQSTMSCNTINNIQNKLYFQNYTVVYR